VEFKKKIMIEIGSILTLVIAFILVISILDYHPAKTTGPEPGPVPDPGNTTSRSFIWDKPGISKSYHLNTTIQVRPEAYDLAQKELFDTTPSKIRMYSDSEYFDIARTEILHSEYGNFNYELTQVANYLNGVANSELLSDIEFAEIILSFTQEQCIPYSYDKDSTGYDEYMRFPLETIYDITGDCDCKAILACALFKTLGYRVAFALMPGHAAMLITLPQDDLPFANFVWQGKRWFYCETTGDYWSPGQIPESVDADSIDWQGI